MFVKPREVDVVRQCKACKFRGDFERVLNMNGMNSELRVLSGLSCGDIACAGYGIFSN